METIAIRTYPIDERNVEYVGRAYLYRKKDGAFLLRETSNSPMEATTDEIYDTEQAFAWLRESPHQIEILDTDRRDTLRYYREAAIRCREEAVSDGQMAIGQVLH